MLRWRRQGDAIGLRVLTLWVIETWERQSGWVACCWVLVRYHTTSITSVLVVEPTPHVDQPIVEVVIWWIGHKTNTHPHPLFSVPQLDWIGHPTQNPLLISDSLCFWIYHSCQQRSFVLLYWKPDWKSLNKELHTCKKEKYVGSHLNQVVE